MLRKLKYPALNKASNARGRRGAADLQHSGAGGEVASFATADDGKKP
jgi:hypothetical protein